MIIYPKNWDKIGQPVEIRDLEIAIIRTLREIPCESLALSGGLDSSLLLYFMLKVHRQVKAFTIGGSEKHRDIKYAALVAEELGRTKHLYYVPTQREIDEEKDQDGDLMGDKAVRLFYRFVRNHTWGIISGDGIDEFMCGYYNHQSYPTEPAYFRFIRRLQRDQLEPLDRNSMGVKVYLPYLDAGLLYLLGQIPTYEKVTERERKILMIKMAAGKIPEEILMRHKIGFCDALETKGRRS